VIDPGTAIEPGDVAIDLSGAITSKATAVTIGSSRWFERAGRTLSCLFVCGGDGAGGEYRNDHGGGNDKISHV